MTYWSQFENSYTDGYFCHGYSTYTYALQIQIFDKFKKYPNEKKADIAVSV